MKRKWLNSRTNINNCLSICNGSEGFVQELSKKYLIEIIVPETKEWRIPAVYGEFWHLDSVHMAYLYTSNRIALLVINQLKEKVLGFGLSPFLKKDVGIKNSEGMFYFENKYFYEIALIAQAKRRRRKSSVPAKLTQNPLSGKFTSQKGKVNCQEVVEHTKELKNTKEVIKAFKRKTYGGGKENVDR